MMIHKFNKERNRKYNKGFTTVELIIVIVLLMIIAGGLLFGAAQWTQNIKFMRQNENARTIFVAAQNQLTEYSTSGQLEKLQKKLQNAQGNYVGVVDVANLKDSDGNDYDLDKVWPESEDKSTDKAKYRGDICSIIGTPSDYEDYRNYRYNGGKKTDERKIALYDMISSYLYDTSILAEGVVCVEFTPDDGQVFAVLYSDIAYDFTYTDTSDHTGTVSISNRETSYRKDRMVGYYGVDTLYKATSTKAEKPTITSLRLNNEDTLNLSFQIGKVKAAAGDMLYEIVVYEKSGRERLKIMLDGTKLRNFNALDSKIVNCAIERYQYDNSGTKTVENLEGYPILAWLEENGGNPVVRIVLDGADQDAATMLYKGEDGYKNLKETMSFRRFGLEDVEDIYCTVRGTKEGLYKPTAMKQSNIENAAFAQAAVKKSTDDGTKASVTYTLKNARHLYNMRYLEDFTEDDRKDQYTSITYKLASDIDWVKFVENGSLFKSGVVQSYADSTQTPDNDQTSDLSRTVDNHHTEFTSIIQLRENSTLDGKIGSPNQYYTIKGLSIKVEGNNPAGLFLKNEGTITNVSLDQITVEGGTDVGAFCGQNAGTLTKLSVKNTDQKSRITGICNVGGIVGSQIANTTGDTQSQTTGDTKSELSGLVNYAHVTERAKLLDGEGNTENDARKNFGGIIGHLTASGTTGANVTAGAASMTTLTVRNCKNYGVVMAKRVQEKAAETQNIGGITGSAQASSGCAVTIDNCVSSPQYTEIQTLLSSGVESGTEKLKSILYGKYVGGIVGYNDGGTITNCNTQKEGVSKEGYIIGSQYVGGIVGFNAAEGSTVDGKHNDKNSVNEAHVLGQQYVGGIIGGNPTGTVQNWENRGFVAATKEYAGGISGYNGLLPEPEADGNPTANGANVSPTAEIKDCESEVANTAAVAELSKQTDWFQADFVGGISGYNNASIIADKEISLVSTVTGKNFVGGVVGYNDVDAVVENYGVVGGYVNATGTFVGGFCGLNSSVRLLQDADNNRYYVRSNPNLVKGGYCVGGVIGGNIVPASEDTKEITCGFAADNFLGELRAEGAYAGGYIGCNWMVKKTNDIRKEIMVSAKKSADQCQNNLDLYKTNSEEALKNMAYAEQLLEHGNLQQSDCKFIINGSGNVNLSSGNSQARLGNITAMLYVGGVVGCNEPNTYLEIKNVENKTPVKALASVSGIDREQGQRKAYDKSDFSYSYAGGIIGKVTKSVTLDNCRNSDSGSVTSQGTYTGGLCEINEGKIINCTASSLGSSKKDYVGGIVGLNKSTGIIRDCKLENDRTITGRNGVGGIAAENFGTITGVSLDGNVLSYGSIGYVGGVAAYNAGTIELSASADGKSNLNVTVKASGNYVGGVVGVNDAGNIVSSNSLVFIKGSVSGKQYVGGFVGKNSSASGLLNLDNQAEIIADRGYAGGIVGISSGSISNCKNEGEVTARQSGRAGGIVSENTSTISGCENTGTVSASNGLCGGIAATNGIQYENNNSIIVPGASITDCEVHALDGDTLTFIGKDRVGGICAENHAKIENSKVYNIVLNDLASSTNNLLGGITAFNAEHAVIDGCKVGQYTKNNTTVKDSKTIVTIVSLTKGASAGGAAGKNEGAITNTNVQAELKFIEKNMAYYGNLGGVAGENLGTLDKCAFSGTVVGTANSAENAPQYNPTTDYETSGAIIYGYGGIAGVNGSSVDMISAEITNCTVLDAEITGLGDAYNIVNLGGIAGVNGKGAKIENVSVGTGTLNDKKLVQSNSAKAYLETNAAYNVYVGTKDSTSAYGHTGGVAGLNSGWISNVEYTTDTEAPTSSVAVENYRGHVGGIVGYNRRTGIIKDAQTGAKWTVYAPTNAVDNGCGGIIGYQAGEGDLTDCINRARVVKTVVDSNGVGGIIGRMEIATAKNYLIKNCKNYGELYGYRRVGGIIGVAKYYGGTLSDCVNYGTITSINGQGTGGIIGHLYGMKSDYGAIYITGCQNHGFIDGREKGYSAGIVGGATQGYPELHIENCVNTGLIRGEAIAGITVSSGGGFGLIDSGKSKIINCRNYGYAYDSDNMGGIVSSTVANELNIKGCFGISPLKCPIAPSGKVTAGNNNYYITKEPEESTGGEESGDNTDIEEDPVYIQKIDGSSKLQGDAHLYKLAGKATSADLSDGSRAWYKSTDKPDDWIYTITLSRPIKLSELTLYWFNDSGKREQDYEILYSEEENGEFSKCAEMINSKNHGCAEQKQIIQLKSVVKAKRIRIKVNATHALNGGTNKNICLMRVHFKYDSNESFEGQMSLSNNNYECTIDGLQKVSTQNPATFEYIKPKPKPNPVTPPATGGITVAGTPVYVSEVESGKYTLKTTVGGAQVGVSGFTMNPYNELINPKNKAMENHNLTFTGSDYNNIRYELFEKIDSYMIPTAFGVESLDSPKNLKFENIPGGVKLSWNEVSHAHYYWYSATYYDKDRNVLFTREDTVYSTSVDIPVTEINGTPVKKISVKVKAGADTQNGRIWSDEVEKETVINSALPAPKFHFEMILDGETLKYKAFLDNKDEYIQFLKDNHVLDTEVEAKLGKIDITISANNTQFTFNAAKAESDTYYNGTSGNVTFTADAKYTGTDKNFSQSAQTMRESLALMQSEYKNEAKFSQVLLSKTDDEKKEVGFYGDTNATLQYMAKLKFSKQITYYMRTELLATDENLGVPVSVSSSDIRLSDTSKDFIKTLLSSLPTDLMDKYTDITLRSYPTLMSNNVVYNGHDVELPTEITTASKKQGAAADQLKTMYVTADGYIADSSQSGATKLIGDNNRLAAGYVIRLLPDGSYGLYYNALLAYNANKGLDQIPAGQNSAKTWMKTQVYTYNWSKDTAAKLEKQNKPVIRVNADDNGNEQDPNMDEMVITWDLKAEGYNTGGKSNYQEGAVYDYTVTGSTVTGESVQIITGTYTTKNTENASNTEGNNTLKLDTTTWKYNKITISISRRGKTNDKGQTEILPNGSVREVNLKLSLSQIEAPALSLHADASGNVQKNALIYDIEWSNVPNVTDQLPSERTQLKGFEITAVRNEKTDTAAVDEYAADSEGDTGSGEDTDSKKDAAAKAKEAWESLTTLYNEKSGKNKPDSDTTNVGANAGEAIWTWDATENGMSVKKTMKAVLKQSGDTWRITKNLETVWVMSVTGEQKNAESLKTFIDLSDYERGEALQISVRALAVDGAADYRNGPAGVAAEMTLPSRLDVPNVSNLNASPDYNINTAVTTEDIEENGIKLTYTENADPDTRGSYQIAAALYQYKQDDDWSKVTGDWSDDAERVLFDKDNPQVMNGNLLSADYTLKELQRTYGGMWLKIAMRSISDSNISSWWSDEDAAAEDTLNYQWIQIPRVREDTPNIMQGTTSSVPYEFKDGQYIYGNSIAPLNVSQTSLQWETGELAEHYKITIVRNQTVYDGAETSVYEGEDSKYNGYTTRIMDWIFLKKNAEGGYDVYYNTSDPSFKADERKAALARANEPNPTYTVPAQNSGSDIGYEDMVLIGKVAAGGHVLLPWTGTAGYVDNGVETRIQTVSWIALTQYDNGKEMLTLQLPDITSVNNTSMEDIETDQVVVQAVVDDIKTTRYEHSYTKLLHRVNGVFEESVLENVSALPTLSTIFEALSDSGYLRMSIEPIQNAWLVCRIQIKDAAGQTATRYVSSYGLGTTDIPNVIFLPPVQQWKGDVEITDENLTNRSLTVNIDIAAIDILGQGISQWGTYTDVINNEAISEIIKSWLTWSKTQDTETDAQTEFETDAQTEFETDSQIESETDSQTESETDAQTESVSDVSTANDGATNTEVDTSDANDGVPDTEIDAPADGSGVTDTQTDTETSASADDSSVQDTAPPTGDSGETETETSAPAGDSSVQDTAALPDSETQS